VGGRESWNLDGGKLMYYPPLSEFEEVEPSAMQGAMICILLIKPIKHTSKGV
jgi:hypothetical protein